MNEQLNSNPDSELMKVISYARAYNLNYIKHYDSLLSTYTSENECHKRFLDLFKHNLHRDILRKSINDDGGKLREYLKANPNLEPWKMIVF